MTHSAAPISTEGHLRRSPSIRGRLFWNNSFGTDLGHGARPWHRSGHSVRRRRIFEPQTRGQNFARLIGLAEKQTAAHAPITIGPFSRCIHDRNICHRRPEYFGHVEAIRRPRQVPAASGCARLQEIRTGGFHEILTYRRRVVGRLVRRKFGANQHAELSDPGAAVGGAEWVPLGTPPRRRWEHKAWRSRVTATAKRVVRATARVAMPRPQPPRADRTAIRTAAFGAAADLAHLDLGRKRMEDIEPAVSAAGFCGLPATANYTPAGTHATRAIGRAVKGEPNIADAIAREDVTQRSLAAHV